VRRQIKWCGRLATIQMVATFLLLAGSQSLGASDQASTGQPTGQATGQPAGKAEVKIDNFSFGPETLTVSVGTTVIWTNRDDIPHTVVSTEGVFKSKVRDTDETFSYTFSKAGTYPYYCSVHPKMTGKIVVQ
jgi:plastocyanin